MYYFPDTEYIYSSLMSGFFTKEEINPKLNELCINYEKVRDEYRSVKDQLVYTNWNSNNAYNTIDKNPYDCLLYTSPSPRDRTRSRMPSSA